MVQQIHSWARQTQFLICIVVVFFSYALKVTANEKQATVNIEPYQNSSFAPIRGESFSVPITLTNSEVIKQVSVEIRNGDNDLVRNLILENLLPGKSQYVLEWDGKDSTGVVVPDEAYFPVIVVQDNKGSIERIDFRKISGGEEVFDFEKKIARGRIEYTLPVDSRVLIRSGIKNGPMLRTIIDWEPRTAGFHAERWNGLDADKVIAIEQHKKSSYLIIGYQLPDHSIISYANNKETYRAYRERKKMSPHKKNIDNRLLERGGRVIRPEFYNPVLQQKSPRISVALRDKNNRQHKTIIKGFDEIITEVKIHPLDEIYLDQERYEISFFIDNEFIAEEEQGYVPFTWRWSPGRHGIKPGKHVLTVNVSGYNGQVGVKNTAFTMVE